MAECDHRRAAGHSLDHHKPERLGPVDREQQRACISKEIVLLVLADLSYKIYLRPTPQQGLYVCVKVRRIRIVSLGRDFKRQSRCARQTDCDVGSFFWGDPAEKRKVTLRPI